METKYQIQLIPRSQREAQIDRCIAEAETTEDFYDFRSQKLALKVVRLPVGLPVYRMENFRTFSDQAEYLAREKRPADFFSAGQENESAQQVQHGILARLAQKGTNSVVPIYTVLERDGQRGRILITHGGTVVNGNRRLAAMRELLAANDTNSGQFAYVDCLVLPKDATSDDILEIEGKLQAIPETRLDYDWIGDAKLLQEMLKLKGRPEAVAMFLGRKAGEVKNTLLALGEADLYLKEWAKAPGQYSLVSENGEQFFKDLAGEVQGKPLQVQEGSRAIAWTLFEKRNKLEGRLYNYNVTFGPRSGDVLERLADELGIGLTAPQTVAGGDFDFAVDADDLQVSYQPLIDVLRDGAKKDDAADALVDICASVLESERERKSGRMALKTITAANAKLCEVDISRATPDSYDAIAKQLDAIVQRAAELKQSLDKLLQSKT